MTTGLKEHLVRCESAMHAAAKVLSTLDFPTDQRTLTVVGFISVLIEHQESVLLLVIHGNPGSASALIRPIVEGAFRALWINGPATEAEVKGFVEKDVIQPKFGEIAVALDGAYEGRGMFQGFKARTWDPLNSFTHGGMHQIRRRFIDQKVANDYNEEDLHEITTMTTLVVLLTISLFLEKHGHRTSVDRIQSLLTYFDGD